MVGAVGDGCNCCVCDGCFRELVVVVAVVLFLEVVLVGDGGGITCIIFF